MNTQVVVLNGGSSSGKSRIARDLHGGVDVGHEFMALQDAWMTGLVAMARAGADVVHRGVLYDLEVDTTRTGSVDCARTIAAHLRSSRGERPD